MDPHTASHVRLLSIFHYVLAGLSVLFSVVPVLYLAMGYVLLSGRFDGKGPNPPPPEIGWVFLGLGAALLVLGLAYLVLLLLAARFLGTARHWTFCVVVAALSCAFVPFGTVLGVFTIVVLVKPEVRAAFEGPRAPAAARFAPGP